VKAVRCPTIVGRAPVEDALDEALSLAGCGGGNVVFLTGTAGVGKSRLVRDLAAKAADADMLVLTGRAAAVGEHFPFREVSEALTAAFRRSPPPMPPDLDAYGAALRVVLPDWVAGPDTEAVPTLRVLEAVVRLLSLLSARQGLLLVLEDLQWAGPEPISVVDN